MCDGHVFFFFRGRNQKLPCDICHKEFRSDKLKKHREVCKKRLPPAKPPKSQRKKETCPYCKKKFERLAKHACSAKKYKPKKRPDNLKKFFPNKKNIKSCSDLSDVSITTITISDEERSEEEQERQSDREFIDDDTEVIESATEHRRVDNDEVRDRLKDLGMEIETETAIKCKWCEEEVYNITEHEKNCKEKKLPCFRCGELFPPHVIKVHHRLCKKINNHKIPVVESSITVSCYKCKQDISITNIKDHAKNCKAPKKKKPPQKKKKKKDGNPTDPPPPPADGDGDNEGNDAAQVERLARQRKGTFFMLNFHGARKYNIIKRLLVYNEEKDDYVIKDWIKQIVLANEFGSGPMPHPHTHAVVTTKEKMNFAQFKEQWKKETKIKIADIQRSKNFSTDVKYVTKEDYRPIIFNIDWDVTSVLCRAYITAEKYERLVQSTYPYVNLAPFQRTSFKGLYDEFLGHRRHTERQRFYESVTLRPWQQKMLKVIEYCDSPRQIIWLIDPVGNNGKTFLSYYLRDMMEAMRVPNANSNDFAFAYNYEKIVVFDYTRESKDHINYDLLEDLKNGSIWSPKYQSAVKSWQFNAKVVCFANFPPKFEALSYDRWYVLELKDGKVRKTRIPQPQPPATPYIVEDTLPDLPTLDFSSSDPEPEPEPLRAFPVGQYLDSTFVVIEQPE